MLYNTYRVHFNRPRFAHAEGRVMSGLRSDLMGKCGNAFGPPGRASIAHSTTTMAQTVPRISVQGKQKPFAALLMHAADQRDKALR